MPKDYTSSADEYLTTEEAKKKREQDSAGKEDEGQKEAQRLADKYDLAIQRTLNNYVDYHHLGSPAEQVRFSEHGHVWQAGDCWTVKYPGGDGIAGADIGGGYIQVRLIWSEKRGVHLILSFNPSCDTQKNKEGTTSRTNLKDNLAEATDEDELKVIIDPQYIHMG